MTMTRRDLLSAAAALAAAPALGARAWAAPLPRDADIVVIGAGAAGISAARRVMAATDQGLVHPVQKRLGSDDALYIAVRASGRQRTATRAACPAPTAPALALAA